jgi:hypothetical protein
MKAAGMARVESPLCTFEAQGADSSGLNAKAFVEIVRSLNSRWEPSIPERI